MFLASPSTCVLPHSRAVAQANRARLQPAFTSLAFSVAFALFTPSEYARYFALYHIGAPLHIFFSEFIDSKDSGPVILSHFYLLSGCAGGLWLEGRGVNRFTGVLVLGVGDALVSSLSATVVVESSLMFFRAGVDHRQARRPSALAWDEQDGRGDHCLCRLDRYLRLGFARDGVD